MSLESPLPVTSARSRPRVVVIGAGVGGLAAAIRLAAAGSSVTVLDRHGHTGGKIRTLPSAAGPVDAGPTVLTLRAVFDELFAAAGACLDDHVRLIPQDILARHAWPDGGRLDLLASAERSEAAIHAFSGARSAREFRAFNRRCAMLFDAFDAPMMRATAPSLAALARHVLARPHLLPGMAPGATLAGMLRRQFSDPRLAQLFGRYATYVGGSPYRAPAVLALIWQAEASGVWVVEGGMHRLAGAMTRLATQHGAEFRLNAHVERIETVSGRATGVRLSDGSTIGADAVLFNGDPRALAIGALGPAAGAAAPGAGRAPRSYSARVHSFAATPRGFDLAHHNVFFAADAAAEFRDLEDGRVPADPTVYICAEDRGQGRAPRALERFEFITNAPATTGAPQDGDLDEWHRSIMERLARFGLEFAPGADAPAITTPPEFDRLFPATQGAIYGQSPHGLMSAFRRPTARSAVPGLYLAGGGTHPGAGVPMATLSGQHAAEAILSDLTSASMWAPTAMRGGMSTA